MDLTVKLFANSSLREDPLCTQGRKQGKSMLYGNQKGGKQKNVEAGTSKSGNRERQRVLYYIRIQIKAQLNQLFKNIYKSVPDKRQTSKLANRIETTVVLPP